MAKLGQIEAVFPQLGGANGTSVGSRTPLEEDAKQLHKKHRSSISLASNR